MRVLMAASECAPFVKTGGLADVVGALPAALSQCGVDTRVMLPAYPALFPHLPKGKTVAQFDDLPGGAGKLVAVTAKGIKLLLLDMPQLFDRPGGLYVDENGNDFEDNAIRFGALSQAAARVAMGALDDFLPDVLHAHDWQAALAPVYLRMAGRSAPKTIITIHNIAFQGRFGAHEMGPLGLRDDWFHPEGLEYYGDLNFLKGALAYSDKITTVSPTYAREILTPEFGMGLEGVLQNRSQDLLGLLNGIDIEAWDPAKDPAIARGYDARSPNRKTENRAALVDRFNLASDSQGPLFCVISRLTEQKGLDALLRAVPYLVKQGAQLAVLGSGAPDLEAGFQAAAERFSGQVGVFIGYDEPLSHLLQAGSDAILIPSRFEPCGLTQLYGLRYGTLPVVARTGGLADTVIDANLAASQAGVATGFMLEGVTQEAIEAAIDRVISTYNDTKAWRMMQRNAMRHGVDWAGSAEAYSALYESLAG